MITTRIVLKKPTVKNKIAKTNPVSPPIIGDLYTVNISFKFSPLSLYYSFFSFLLSSERATFLKITSVFIDVSSPMKFLI